MLTRVNRLLSAGRVSEPAAFPWSSSQENRSCPLSDQYLGLPLEIQGKDQKGLGRHYNVALKKKEALANTNSANSVS